MEHVVNVERVRKRFDRTRFRAWCSCGYESRPFAAADSARRAGDEHARDRSTVER